ncbi:AraC family transcriptional regulator with amidase-like domain [Pseudomonas sp. SJZ079]|uniref:GlxA family transcriptional regulator n=1 Tax=Pseudomonas sp. SJZ079 TaxID=2572887 RepID=UPI0011992B00|nr:GlxA family transcriptional regulator [Pseudomonas sp. SJZ079]TWC43252.1 AraC family transcriptional regulator with amidase-like domain [Pseudomonas sp. SJZ079]
MRSSFESLLKNKNMAHLDRNLRSGPAMPKRRVAFVLLDNFSMMAFTGAVDALVTANLMSPTPLYEVLVVGGADAVVVSDLGIAISAGCRLVDLDEKRLDMLVMCGGFRVRLQADPLIRSKLRSAEAAGAMLGGLWNGAYFLAEAGLLDGYECAFHPDGRAMMAELFPKVKLSSHSHVLDRERISCAGANSSLGMMLEVVRRSCGEQLVCAIEEVLSCDKMQEVMDVSVVAVDYDPTLPQALKVALELMHNNIDEPLVVDEIATCVGISRRQLERLFCRHVNATPSRYYLELRLTRARQLLQQTNKSLADIAVASGFVSISHFRRCFREFFDIAPGRFRTTSQARR